jgi:hypothetical protein
MLLVSVVAVPFQSSRVITADWGEKVVTSQPPPADADPLKEVGIFGGVADSAALTDSQVPTVQGFPAPVAPQYTRYLE